MKQGTVNEFDFNAILERLSNNDPSFTELDLTGESIDDIKAKALAEALKTNTTLHTLNLSHCTISTKGIEALTNAIATNQTLHTLNCANNKMGEIGTVALAKALETNKTLRILDCSANDIRPKGAEVLAKALATNQTLQVLNIESNPIANAGAIALAKALKMNQTLHTLICNANNIRPKGAEALAKTLETNQTLHTLFCSRNHIGCRVKALTKALETNKTLRRLYLSSNNISNEILEALAKALETNKTLRELDLQDNKGLNTRGTQAFAHMLETNKTITTLHLSAPKAAAPFTSRINELLERNNKRLEYRREWAKPFAEDTAIRFFNHVAESSSEIVPMLPNEMALHIEQFLSLVDSYQLALTCKAAVTNVNHQNLPIHQPIDEEREKKPHKRKIEETKPEKELTTKQTEDSWGLWVQKRRKLSEVATENSENLIQEHPPSFSSRIAPTEIKHSVGNIRS